MSTVGFIGYNTLMRDGLEFRFPVEERKLFSAKVSDNFSVQAKAVYPCSILYPEFKDFHACFISKNRPPEILIVGDSHARQYFDAFSSIFSEKSVMTLNEFACLPFAINSIARNPRTNCVNKMEEVAAFIKDNKSIESIYVMGYWKLLQGYLTTQKMPQKKELSSEEIAFIQNGERFLSEIAQKNILLFLDNPDNIIEINSCLRRARIWGKLDEKSCAIDYYDHVLENTKSTKLMEMLVNKFPGINIFDPKEALCENGKCPLIIDGFRCYSDHNHLTAACARRVANHFVKKFQ